ncbi:MAG: HEPN domain-containing protein [Thermodesulfobacteriota bacterium]
MTKEVRELLEKAEQSLGAAQILLAQGYADFAAGRAYYAMFYAAEARLLAMGLAYSKHSAVIAAFGRELVKSGRVDARLHRVLLRAFDLRNLGDYGGVAAVDPEQARQAIADAAELCAAMRQDLETAHGEQDTPYRS